MPRGLLETSPSSEERTETDNITSIELERNRRVLYFSDGTMEEPSDVESDADADETDKNLEVAISENDLALMPRLRYKASKMGSHILAGIDYVGGGLASLLGITTPKYASEMQYFKRTAIEREVNGTFEDANANATWQNNESGGNLDRVITVNPKRAEHEQAY